MVMKITIKVQLTEAFQHFKAWLSPKVKTGEIIFKDFIPVALKPCLHYLIDVWRNITNKFERIII